jgi:hypothetical protein
MPQMAFQPALPWLRRILLQHRKLAVGGLLMFVFFGMGANWSSGPSLAVLREKQTQNAPDNLFPDLPWEHVVYQAWKPLLVLNTPITTHRGQAAPYQPLAGKDWDRAVRHIGGRFSPTTSSLPLVQSDSDGLVGADDLETSLIALSRDFPLRQPISFPVFSDPPSRMEAFAALATLVENIR